VTRIAQSLIPTFKSSIEIGDIIQESDCIGTISLSIGFILSIGLFSLGLISLRL